MDLSLCSIPIPTVIDVLLNNFFCVFLHGRVVRGRGRTRHLRLRGVGGSRLRARLGFLGTRCRPRFLFGMLGAICFRVSRGGRTPQRALRRLSSLLHCRLCGSKRGIRIHIRIRCLGRCVDLYGLHTAGQLRLRIRFSRVRTRIRVCPLLFMPLIRGTFGCIKKGCFVTVSVYLGRNGLYFDVRGSVPRPLIRRGKGRKVNVRGLEHELRLLCPRHRALSVGEKSALFEMGLIVRL